MSSSMSVNEMAMQNICGRHFLQPGGLSEVEETVAYIWPQVGKISETSAQAPESLV
jgi:hypothetical protein